jgi:hypothetical protein
MSKEMAIVAAALLTEKETAELVGLSVHWLRRMRWAGGGIPFVKISSGRGGAVRYRREDVENFISARVRRSTSDPGTAAA